MYQYMQYVYYHSIINIVIIIIIIIIIIMIIIIMIIIIIISSIIIIIIILLLSLLLDRCGTRLRLAGHPGPEPGDSFIITTIIMFINTTYNNSYVL